MYFFGLLFVKQLSYQFCHENNEGWLEDVDGDWGPLEESGGRPENVGLSALLPDWPIMVATKQSFCFCCVVLVVLVIFFVAAALPVTILPLVDQLIEDATAEFGQG